MIETERRKMFHKTVTLGNILSIISTVFSVIGVVGYAAYSYMDFSTSMEKRITLAEQSNGFLSQLIQNQQRQIDRLFDYLEPKDHAEIAPEKPHVGP